MTRCPKHKPVWDARDALAPLSGRVVCANCGLTGSRSNGNRRGGRSARIIWFTTRESLPLPAARWVSPIPAKMSANSPAEGRAGKETRDEP